VSRLERCASGKHSSLLQTLVNRGCRKIDNIGEGEMKKRQIETKLENFLEKKFKLCVGAVSFGQLYLSSNARKPTNTSNYLKCY
jgi:hypothetical protein